MKTSSSKTAPSRAVNMGGSHGIGAGKQIASRGDVEAKPEPPAHGGLKFDTDKPRFDLLDPLYLKGTADVLTFGAQKYDAHNWRKGISYSRVIGALMRHTNAVMLGEERDPETGLLHAYHISCCAMFLARFQEDQRTELDDLQGKLAL